MRILFVTARLPYPPLKGDQVRGYHHLRLLSKSHRVTLASLVDDPTTPKDRDALSPFVDRTITVPLKKTRMAYNLIRGLSSLIPLQTMLYQTPEMRNVIQKELLSGKYDLVYLQLARMAPYLFVDRAIPRVIDLIDALSLNMQRRHLRERGPMKWITGLEWKRMSRYERLICENYDQATVVSPLDREMIGEYANLSINPNGVDLSKFSFVSPESRDPSSEIIFTGNMSYFPNANAVLWFVEQVLPLVHQSLPDVRFVIVGANPSDSVKRLADSNPSVRVTGFVESVQDFLARAALAVVPLQAGSGMQFKVIESMATGTPLVVTPYALGGIDAIEGQHLLVSSDAKDFADKVVLLMKSQSLRTSLSQNGRRLVEERFAWEKTVSDLELVFEEAIRTKKRRGQ